MKLVHRISYIGLCSCLMALPGFSAGVSAESTQAKDKKGADARKVIARVNGQPIYTEQLDPEVNRGLRRFQRHGAKTQDPELIQRVRKGVLDKLIDHELIEQESRKLTIEDVEEQVDQRLKTLEQKYGAGKRMEMYWKIRNHTLESARECVSEFRFNEWGQMVRVFRWKGAALKEWLAREARWSKMKAETGDGGKSRTWLLSGLSAEQQKYWAQWAF